MDAERDRVVEALKDLSVHGLKLADRRIGVVKKM
jgi:hypothetical protein